MRLPEPLQRLRERPRVDRAVRVALAVKEETKRDHTFLAAAGVAFYAFLALIPALAAAVSVFALVVDPSEIESTITDGLSSLPTEAQDLLSSQLTSLAESSSSQLSVTLAVSLLLSLWAASSGMGHLVESINIVWNGTETRNMVMRRLVALGLTAGALVVTGVAIAVMAVLPQVLDAADLPNVSEWLLRVGAVPLQGLVFALGVTTLYRFGPNIEDARWQFRSPGVLVAVLLWLISSFGFSFYASTMGSYAETYGSLAAVVLLMLWLFLTIVAVLIGAEVNSQVDVLDEHETTTIQE